MRLPGVFVLVCGVAIAFGGCTSRGPSPAAAGPAATPSPTPVPTALPPVAAAPAQTLPAWIAGISPTGEAKDGSQIRVRFASDVVPVEALESPDRQAALAHVRIDPPLPGHFVFLTPRMIGFEADAPVPHAARVRVTLTAGFADLAGHTLASDVAWSFTTEPLTLTNVPGSDPSSTPSPQSRTPRIGIDASDPVDVGSLLAHAKLIDETDASQTVDLKLAPSPSPDPSASAEATSDASGADQGGTGAHYDLVPARQLAYDRSYRLDIGVGVMPAAGNLGTAQRYRGEVKTYGPLAFTGLASVASERFTGTMPSLAFSNPIDAATLEKAIAISPSPAPGVALAKVDDDGGIGLNPDAFEPNASYTIAIAPTLADTFGQTLGTAQTATFRTGHLAPNIGAPTGERIFPSGLDLALDVQTVNLPDHAYSAAYAVLHPEDVIATDLSSSDAIEKLLGARATWAAHPVAAAADRELDTAQPLRALVGGTAGTLAYGVRARTTRTRQSDGTEAWNEPEFDGVVQLTNLGVFTQWFPDGGFVRVHHLADGSPAAGATVAIYESFVNSTGTPPANEAPCASGTTGADGTWRPSAAAWSACASTAQSSDVAPELVTIVRDGADWSYARSSSFASGYDVGLQNDGWSAGAPNARGSLISDRSLYQPGETAKFVGVSYFETDGTIGRGTSRSFAVVAVAPDGSKRSIGSGTPDAFGAFSVTFAIPKNAAVGDWQLQATGQNGESLQGAFTVAEFKPPNFKVDLSLDEKPVAAGTSLPASSRSTYLFGAPVEGGTSHVAITRARAYFAPDGYGAFSFGRIWTYPEEEPSVSSDVLQRDLPIGSTGDAAFAVPVATDLPYPMTYTVSAQTTDVSNLAVADTKSFVALPSDVTIGLKSAFVAEAGKAFDVDAVAVGLDGKPVSGRALHLVLQQRIDASATQIVEGGEAQHAAVRYVDVASQDVTSGADPVRATFTAPKAGDYRVRANFANAASDVTATDAELWITGPGEASWIAGENTALGVKLDKATYEPGDVAHVLVQSPYPDAEMFLAVVRHGVILQRTENVHGAAPEATFTVTPEMLPNAVIQAVLVRRGPSLARGVPSGLTTLERIGFAPFEVALDAKYVKVTLKPATATVEPSGHERIAVHLSAKNGAPVRGELTIAVVNDAILQLSGYRFPDLVRSVYADEPISTRLADNYGNVTLKIEHATLDKGFGFGGGVMAGPASTRVRTNFQPLAYWNAAVKTDANGDASVDVALPDDLTTWRVLALALTPDARFGNGETTFIATKPLVTDPILPQFARPGDRFAAGVSVTNVAHASGDVSVNASVSGGATFAAGTPNAAATGGPSQSATQAYRFDVLASGPADASFTMRTALGGNADAFTFGVPILSDDVLESAITTGATTGSAGIPLDVAASLHGPLGGLDVTLASTLLAEALEPTRTLLRPHLGFGTELAGRVAVASDAIVLDRRYGRAASVPALQKNVATDLDALRALALPDGGFAEWPSEKKSEAYTTAFIVQQLLQARAAGFEVGPDLAHALGYLRKVLASPYDLEDVSTKDPEAAAEVRLEALETLGAAGDARTDFLSDVWTYQPHFSYYERVELARFLLRIPSWRARGMSLRDQLFQNVNLGARHATVDLRGGFGESETAGQAQMLQLAIASGVATEDVDRLLESLLNLRHDGRWGCVCDDAEAMNGIVLYAALDETPPDFTATAAVPSTPAQTFSQAFNGYAQTTVTKTVPLAQLARGSGHVELKKSGTGTLHYAVALRYQVPDTSPGIYQGLRIDRIVRAPGAPAVLATFGIPAPASTTTFASARVLDIEDRIVTDHPVDDILVTDPLPAGFEAVDQSFRTTAPMPGESNDSFAIDYQSIYENHVLSFASHLEPGSYAIHYLVRSVTPGTFAWPGATVQLQYEPEEFGRTAATKVVVEP
jgi:hypothetical protein